MQRGHHALVTEGVVCEPMHTSKSPLKKGSVKGYRCACLASRTIARNRPSGVYSRVSSTVISTCLARSPTSRITIRTFISNGILALTNRISSSTAISIATLTQGIVTSVNCASPTLKFATSTYLIFAGVRRRSGSVGRNIARTRKSHVINDNSRNVVCNCTAGRATGCVPLAIGLTRKLIHHLSQMHRSATLKQFLQPSKGSRIAVHFSSRKRPINVRDLVLSTRRDRTVKRSSLHRLLRGAIVRPIYDS